MFLNQTVLCRLRFRALFGPFLLGVVLLTLPAASGQVTGSAPGLGAPQSSAPATGQVVGTRTQQGTGQNGPQTAADRAAADEKRRDPEDVSVQNRAPAPDAPSEFQRLVESTLGTALPIYGSSLFNGVPSTFAPADNIPVTPDYVIGPGDELRIQLTGQVNQQGTVTVDRNGGINLPDVGTVHVAGVPYAQLQSFLQQQLGRVYRNFQLSVTMGQLRSMQIFVTGESRRQGAFTISSLSTLLNALLASGGVLPQGSLRDIQVKRGGATIDHFDLYELLLRGDKTKDVTLEPGDVIFIPTVGPQVAVAGSVQNPAIYEVTPGTTVDQAVALAGGRTNLALGGQVRLDRVFEHTMRSIVDLDMTKGQNPSVQNGDILTIAAIVDRYRDAVTLRGNVSFPGRYVWHEGMRISDLVPTKEQLVTREYYRRRNALGNVNNQAPSAGAEGALGVRGTAGEARADQATQTGASSTFNASGNSVGSALTESNTIFGAINDVVLSAPDIDFSYAVIERLNPLTMTTVLVSFNPGRLYLEGDQTQNLVLNSGDVITFFSTADIKVPGVQQTRFVRLEGEFIAPGPYSVQPGETLRHLLERAGGLTPSAYLYASEFTRESTRRIQEQRLNEYAASLDARISAISARNNANATTSQDSVAAQQSTNDAREVVARLRRIVPLGRIVLPLKPDSHGIDSIPDMPLEDGDRFVVPSTPSTVSVEGQVYSANAFIFERGRKERDYLHQAGGPDREADAKRTFILRADGSVYSQQYGNVTKANMFPGDTVVVPPKLERHAYLRDFIDLSAIAGQFGLLTAAFTILR